MGIRVPIMEVLVSEHPPIVDPAGLRRRLLGKVKVDIHGCWIFQGYMDESGYGRICIGVYQFALGTHVASWIVHYGEPPAGLHILHRCNVPACCNPRHLYLGTAQDNANDRLKNAMLIDGFDDYESPKPTLPTLANSEFGVKFPPDEDLDGPPPLWRI